MKRTRLFKSKDKRPSPDKKDKGEKNPNNPPSIAPVKETPKTKVQIAALLLSAILQQKYWSKRDIRISSDLGSDTSFLRHALELIASYPHAKGITKPSSSPVILHLQSGNVTNEVVTSDDTILAKLDTTWEEFLDTYGNVVTVTLPIEELQFKLCKEMADFMHRQADLVLDLLSPVPELRRLLCWFLWTVEVAIGLRMKSGDYHCCLEERELIVRCSKVSKVAPFVRLCLVGSRQIDMICGQSSSSFKICNSLFPQPGDGVDAVIGLRADLPMIADWIRLYVKVSDGYSWYKANKESGAIMVHLEPDGGLFIVYSRETKLTYGPFAAFDSKNPVKMLRVAFGDLV